MSSAPRPVVTVRDLGKIYSPSPGWMRFLVRTNLTESVIALQDVDLEVYPGQACAIVGPNGAGKTTLFRILVGLTTPTSGSASVFDHDVVHESATVRRLVGWMSAEHQSLFMRLTCRENLHFHGRLHGLRGDELRRRIDATLEEVGLGARSDSTAYSLSAGMRARLQLARALLHRPRLLILDEPTSSIDPVAAHELMNLIMSIVEERRISALVSSHRLEEIEALGANVVLLDRGRIRYRGDLETLRHRWQRPRLELVFRSAEAAHQAAKRAKLLELGDIELLGDETLQLAMAPDLSTGEVLEGLGDLTELLHVRETRVPLRELLAQVYLNPTRTSPT